MVVEPFVSRPEKETRSLRMVLVRFAPESSPGPKSVTLVPSGAIKVPVRLLRFE